MPAISYIQTIFVMAMNILTDFYLMAIPVPMVWTSHLHWRKKVTLTLMFSGGFLQMAFGALRCVSILTVRSVDAHSQYHPAFAPWPQLTESHCQVGDKDPAQSGYWSVRESFVSFVLTNLPMLYPLFRNFLEKVNSTISLSNTNGATGRTGSNGQAYRLSSYPESRSKPKPKDPNPLPEFGSDEHIIPCEDDSRAASIGQAPSEAEADTDERHVRNPFQHGNNRAKAFHGASHQEHTRSTSNSPANGGGIMVTTDFVVTEVHDHQTHGGKRGDAYLDV